MSSDPASQSKVRGLAWVSLAYVLAITAGSAAVWSLRSGAPEAALAAGYGASVLVVFAFSAGFRNSSFFDAWWSVAPLATLPWVASFSEGLPARRALVVLLVGFWGLRLTFNWARGWSGLHHEDWRYRDLAAKTGRAYWLASFFGLHVFPGVLVYLGTLSIVLAGRGSAPLGPLPALGAFITLGATVIDPVADEQLRHFARSGPPPGAFCEVGVWRWSRHPNYFGELGTWCGLFVLALASGAPAWPAIAGPLAMWALFEAASIPMMEARQRARRPGYSEYQRRVSKLVPWPPRRAE